MAFPPLSISALNVVNTLEEEGFKYVFGMEVFLESRVGAAEVHGFGCFVSKDGVESLHLYRRKVGSPYEFFKVTDKKTYLRELSALRTGSHDPVSLAETAQSALVAVFRRAGQSGGGAPIDQLRTLCNQRGLSCRDSNGKLLTRSQLIRKLK